MVEPAPEGPNWAKLLVLVALFLLFLPLARFLISILGWAITGILTVGIAGYLALSIYRAFTK